MSGDRAYSSRKNLEAIDKIGATPYIPFKSNTTGKKGGSLIWRNMYLYFKNKPQEFNEHYHLRSNVESTFSMVKQKFSGNLMTRNPTANINEILLKLLSHNICVLIQEYHENKLNIDFPSQFEKQKILLSQGVS